MMQRGAFYATLVYSQQHRAVMTIVFEHNSDAHAQITQRFFAQENQYGFFTELCYPDQLSTLTWNSTAAEPNLDDLLDNLGEHFYTTVLVENTKRDELLSELEQ